jgi:hypothetical protein
MTRLIVAGTASALLLLATPMLAEGFSPTQFATSATRPTSLRGMVMRTGASVEGQPAASLIPVGRSDSEQQQNSAANVFSFKGITLGMHPTELDKSLMCGYDGHISPIERRCEYVECDDVSSLSAALIGEGDTLAGVSLTATRYGFSGKFDNLLTTVLYSIVGNFDSAKFSTVKRAFTDRYGAPDKVFPIELQNNRGAHYTGEQLVWQKDDQFLLLSQYDDKQGTSNEWDFKQSYFTIVNGKEFGRVQQCIKNDF